MFGLPLEDFVEDSRCLINILIRYFQELFVCFSGLGDGVPRDLVPQLCRSRLLVFLLALSQLIRILFTVICFC